MDQKEFTDRLAELRLSKGVSARDMSLSLGQSAGYINNIENGINYPSMAIFFNICEYLGITPKDFFDLDKTNPVKNKELQSITDKLTSEQLDHLITIAKWLK